MLQDPGVEHATTSSHLLFASWSMRGCQCVFTVRSPSAEHTSRGEGRKWCHHAVTMDTGAAEAVAVVVVVVVVVRIQAIIHQEALL